LAFGKVRKTTLQRHANTCTPTLKLPTGYKSSHRLFGIVSEVSRKEFCIREPNACQPKNRAQKRQLFTFDTFWLLRIPAALINRARDNSDNARDNEMSRLLG
jgi:hypothetical protein